MAHKGSINEEKTSRDIGRYSSTLEDVDFAVYKFFDERLELKTKTNKGFRKTPIIWAGSERAHNIKNDKINRDLVGQVILPVISIERDSVKKSDASRGVPYAMVDPAGDIKGGRLIVNRVIKQDKTSNFANADAYRRKKQLNYPLYRNKDNGKIVYETITIPIPIYVDIGYKIVLRTEYQEQMNDLLTPIIRFPNAQKRIHVDHNHNRYEAFIQEDYSMTNTISSYEVNERKYETTITMNVYGYLIGDGDNQQQPRAVRRENAVQIRFARERIIVQDEDGEFRF
tara:strand:+ start:1328 stop:2179 length:852 start_codon:yes stop_codon:yes gene_type:complete